MFNLFAIGLGRGLGAKIYVWPDETTNDLVVVNLIHFDFIEWPQHFDILVEYAILLNSRHGRRMVLLETHDHMAHQGTLRRQESTACLKSHCMPHLAVFKTVPLGVLVGI